MENQSGQNWLENILNQASEKASKQIDSDTEVAEAAPDGDILRVLSQGDRLLASGTFKFLIDQVVATSQREAEQKVVDKYDKAINVYQQNLAESYAEVNELRQAKQKLQFEVIALQSEVRMAKQQLEFSRELSRMKVGGGSGDAFANLPPKMREGYSVAEIANTFIQALFEDYKTVPSDEEIGRWVREHGLPQLPE